MFGGCIIERAIFDQCKTRTVDVRSSELHEIHGWRYLRGVTLGHTLLALHQRYIQIPTERITLRCTMAHRCLLPGLNVGVSVEKFSNLSEARVSAPNDTAGQYPDFSTLADTASRTIQPLGM